MASSVLAASSAAAFSAWAAAFCLTAGSAALSSFRFSQLGEDLFELMPFLVTGTSRRTSLEAKVSSRFTVSAPPSVDTTSLAVLWFL